MDYQEEHDRAERRGHALAFAEAHASAKAEGEWLSYDDFRRKRAIALAFAEAAAEAKAEGIDLKPKWTDWNLKSKSVTWAHHLAQVKAEQDAEKIEMLAILLCEGWGADLNETSSYEDVFLRFNSLGDYLQED